MLRRGRELCDGLGMDLLEVDYHELTELSLDDARARIGFPEKSRKALTAGSPGAFDLSGMSLLQQEFAASL